MPKPKKPNYDPSSLPSGKGITAKPAKMRDMSPNFVRAGGIYKIEDLPDKKWKTVYVGENPGTNEGNKNVPKIEYTQWPAGGRQRANLASMNNEGKFEIVTKKCDYEGCDVPVKNEQLNTIMDKNNKNLKIGNAKKVEKYIK